MTSQTVRVEFQGVQSIAMADGMRERLRAALAAADVVDVDCSGVSQADLGLVQVLVAARRSASAAGKSLRLAAAPSGALLAALRGAGIARPDSFPASR